MTSLCRAVIPSGAAKLRSRGTLVLALIVLLSTAAFAQPLRVCADPDNLPYSNSRQQGIENALAQIIGRKLHRPIEYHWARNRGRGFVRETLNAHACDVLLGIPTDFRGVLTTEPYMRSSYVFVRRKASKLDLNSIDDPQLRSLKIGVQMLDDDYSPPGKSLGHRGLVANLVPFDTVGGDASKIITAVAQGKVDVAVVWGPLAGYYARQQRVPLVLTPIEPEIDPPGIPFTFQISLGVRQNDSALRDQLNAALAHSRPEVRRVLTRFGVPQLQIIGSRSAVAADLRPQTSGGAQ